MKFSKHLIALAVATSLSPYSSIANDEISTSEEQQIEVITVRGDFRQHNLQQSPVSLSVLTQQDIGLRHAQNLEEVIAAIPNVNFASGTQRARYYQIRGIGERSQFKEPINPSVGLIIDDIDFTGIGSVASTFDVAQTEVYRGPQGTRFGANAMAGLINIITHAPTDDFEGKLRLTAGNYASFGAGLVLSGPASDIANYRLAVEKYQSDGFIENTYLERDDTNNRDELTVRGKLAIEASSELAIDINIFHADFDNGYDAFSLDNTREAMSDQPGFDRQKTTALGAKFTYTGMNAFDLVTLLSAADSDLAYGYDEDWSYVGLHPWEYSSTDHYLRDRQTQSVEMRFISNESSRIFNDTSSWLTGVYFKQDREELTRQYTYLETDFFSSFDTDTLAVFAQLESRLTDKLTLVSGLRFEERSADYTNSDLITFDPNDTMMGGKLSLSYQYQPNSMLYASINRGYKAGGVNTEGSLPQALRQFEPEYLWNYELGYKTSFFDGDAYIRTAIFYMDRKDVQVNSSIDIQREDGSSEFISYLGNAATGFNQGLEMEGAWQIDDKLELYGSLGLLDSEFDEYINADGEDLSGLEQAHAPNYQFNLGLNYHPNEDWLVNLSLDGKDEFYFSNSNIEARAEQKSDSVVLVNTSVTYIQDNWQLKAWARNLFDREYKTRGFYFGNDPRDGYQAKAYTQLAEPAVLGMTLDYQF